MFSKIGISINTIVSGSFNYTFIPTRKGKRLLMLDGYTYSQNGTSFNYYCSKKDAGCKARIRLDITGRVHQAQNVHLHERPKYIKTPTGLYFKI